MPGGSLTIFRLDCAWRIQSAQRGVGRCRANPPPGASHPIPI